MKNNVKPQESRVSCKNIAVFVAGKGISKKETCLSDEKRNMMKGILEKRKAAFDALAKY
jgi:hypothetical protein